MVVQTPQLTVSSLSDHNTYHTKCDSLQQHKVHYRRWIAILEQTEI